MKGSTRRCCHSLPSLRLNRNENRGGASDSCPNALCRGDFESLVFSSLLKPKTG